MSTKAQTLRLAVFLALRIARSRSKNALSVVTALSVIGVACGVFALTVVLAVSDGFEKAFQDRILGIYPHLMVTRTRSTFHDWREISARIAESPGVIGATPLSSHRMMASRGPHRAEASIQGVDPETLGGVIDLDALLKEGDLTRLHERVTATTAVAPEGWTITLAGLVAGSAHLVVLSPGEREPRVRLYDDHLRPPPAGRASIRALDLRSPGARGPVHLFGKTERGRSGDGATLLSADDALSPELSLSGGVWRLETTDERFELHTGLSYTLILYTDPGDGTTPRTILMGEAPPAPSMQSSAWVHVADLRHTGEPVTLSAVGMEHPFLSLAPRGDPAGSGTFTEYRPVHAPLPPIFLGKALARKLRTEVGDILSFVTILRGVNMGNIGQFGPQPSSVRFEVAGTFESGFYEQDVSLAITNLRNSERFMNAESVVEALAVRTEDILTLDRTRGYLQRALDPMDFEDLLEGAVALDAKLHTLAAMDYESPLSAPSETSPFVDQLETASRAVDLLRFQGAERAQHAEFQIFDWRDKNANHLSVIELQKIVLTIFFLIIVLVGSFVVVGAQIMIINEKTADIAILRTIGATGPFIRLVFTLQGLFVAVIGVVTGLAVGLGALWILDAVEYELEASIYFIDRLPVQIQPMALVFIALGALACTLLTTQISAARAAAREPVAGLRQVD